MTVKNPASFTMANDVKVEQGSGNEGVWIEAAMFTVFIPQSRLTQLAQAEYDEINTPRQAGKHARA